MVAVRKLGVAEISLEEAIEKSIVRDDIHTTTNGHYIEHKRYSTNEALELIGLNKWKVSRRILVGYSSEYREVIFGVTDHHQMITENNYDTLGVQRLHELELLHFVQDEMDTFKVDVQGCNGNNGYAARISISSQEELDLIVRIANEYVSEASRDRSIPKLSELLLEIGIEVPERVCLSLEKALYDTQADRISDRFFIAPDRQSCWEFDLPEVNGYVWHDTEAQKVYMEIEPDRNSEPQSGWDAGNARLKQRFRDNGFNYDTSKEVNAFSIREQDDLNKIMSACKKAFSYKREKGNIVDQLVAHGVREEAIESNQELWDVLSQIERNDVVSLNDVYHVKDKDGRNLELKISKDETKARISSALNYHLSGRLAFIVPGFSPEPLEANGFYITLQERKHDNGNIQMPLEYWIASLAMFHNEAEKILREQEVDIPTAQLHSVEIYKEQHQRTREVSGINLDEVRLEDALLYLSQKTKQHCVIHKDTKRDNLYGPFLIDLDDCSYGYPGIDLAMVLMQYGIPVERWEDNLKLYLDIRKNRDWTQDNLKELKIGTVKAAYVMSTKEVLGSSSRRLTKETEVSNAQLRQYQKQTESHLFAQA